MTISTAKLELRVLCRDKLMAVSKSLAKIDRVQVLQEHSHTLHRWLAGSGTDGDDGATQFTNASLNDRSQLFQFDLQLQNKMELQSKNDKSGLAEY